MSSRREPRFRARPGRAALALLLALAPSLATPAVAAPAGAAPPRRVLVLGSDPTAAPGNVQLKTALRERLLRAVPDGLDLTVEDLDLVWVATPEYKRQIVDLLRAKYAQRPPELLIAVSSGALRFALDNRAALFPEARLLFGFVQGADVAGVALPGVAGVISDFGYGVSLETALDLLPETRRVVVVLGDGAVESHYEAGWRRELEAFASRVRLDWWVGVPVAELEERVARLPPGTVILYLAVYHDRTGASFVPNAVRQRLAQRASAPLFGPFSSWIGDGTVGDGRFDFGQLGALIGERAGRLLAGETPEQVGIIEAPPGPPTFDARQLARWGIPRDRLPAGSRLLFAAPPIWESHGRWIVGASLVIALQFGLLAGFVVQRERRRRAEAEERRARSLQAVIVDALHLRIAVLDRQGRITSINRAWREFVTRHAGGTPAAGDDYRALVRAAAERGRGDAARTLEALDAVLSGREPLRRLEFAGHGGLAGRWFQLTVAEMGRGERGAVVEIDDVTERRRVEDRFRTAVESLPLAMLLVGADGRVELVNAATERIFGWPRGELLGQPVELLLPEAQREAHAATSERFREHPTSRVMAARREVRGRHRDGHDVPLAVTLQPVETAQGRSVLASVEDLSERRKLEREAQRLRSETAHYGRLATVGELSAAIAHELNQPLTGILSNAQAAQRFLERGAVAPDLLAETVADIAADGKRAGEVIRRLRALLSKGPLELHPLDLNEVIRQVCGLVTQDLQLHDAALDVELAPDLPLVSGDRVHLQQVLINLVLNGVAAMAATPPELRRVRLRTSRGEGRTVRLEVRDTGSGIADEVMPRLFEPFFTTKAEGMGMGLPIVRSIVESHGGRIFATNNPSGGATFTVVLQAAGEAAVA